MELLITSPSLAPEMTRAAANSIARAGNGLVRNCHGWSGFAPNESDEMRSPHGRTVVRGPVGSRKFRGGAHDVLLKWHEVLDHRGKMPFVERQIVSGPDECFFYHAMDLPNWGTVKADSYWDLRGRFEDYTGRVELRGKRFLEIGAASGFVSFEAERRGADVVSFDIEHAEQRQFFPDGRLLRAQQQASHAARRELERLKNAYWLSHASFQSRARAYYGDVYNIPDDIGAFDIVFFGQVLVHLSDPLRALDQGARLCRETIVITEGMFWDWWPRMRFLTGSTDSWWLLSTKLYGDWLAVLGFRVERVTRRTYRFVMPDRTRKFRLGTIVARRENL